MTLLVEKGTFAKTTTTTGLPFTQTVTLSNGSLTPKLLILWTSAQTTNDGTYRDDASMSYGFSDGTNDACSANRTDESAESECYTFRSDSVIAIWNLTSNAIASQADVSSFGAGQFVLNWTVQSDATAQVIHYIVAGGTDITNVSVVSTTVGDTSTGNHSYNGSGTTFTPDFALCMTGADGYTTINTTHLAVDSSLFCIGAAKSTSKRWVLWGRDETVGTSDCDMYIDPSACLASCSRTTGAITFLADFVSFDNAAGGGITVNISDAADASTKKLAFLLVKGSSWDCGAFQQRNGTGTQDVTILTDLNPDLVFLGGINTATDATVTANFHVGIGASDGTNEGCSYFGNTNGLGTFAAVNSNLNTKVYRISTPHATATSSTTNAECDMTDMDTAGQFTLDWTTADSTLRRMAYWTVGTIAAGNNVERSMPTETVTISEAAFTRLAAKNRTGGTQTVTISEAAFTRLAAKMRPLSTENTTESGTVDKSRGRPRSPATEVVTVDGGTLARLAQKTRALSTETTTIGENLARLAAKIRSLATETVTSNGGTVTFIKGKLRTLEENVTVAEASLTRLCNKFRILTTETTSIGESPTRLAAKNRSLSTESVIVGGGTLNRLKGAMRALATETVTVGENLARLCNKIRALVTETVTSNGGSLARLAAKIRSLATEVVAIADNVVQAVNEGQANIHRTITETVTITEASLTRLCNKFRSLATETVTSSEQIARLKGANRSLATQTVSIGESINRLCAKIRNPIENVVSGESLNRLANKFRSISQTIVSSDLAVALKQGPISAHRFLEETVLVSDNLDRFVSLIGLRSGRGGAGGRRLKRRIFKLKRLFEL